ncbi:alpha/beta hydrolase [Gordonia sp. (in: high G+C Gram-positive bacteria)]|uniref:alpha/beta hydrolase n=1 Tax=Gordonia sp. (in: high G+C Gram-positive bacteria) TaxID=84139 RepID=UPI003C7374A9
MRPTIDQLRGWDTAALGAASVAAETNAGKVDDAVDAAVRALDRAESWHGKSHDAATLRMVQERDHAQEVRNVLNQIADEAKDASIDLGFAKGHVLREVDAALTQGYTVTPDGIVSHPDEDKRDEINRIQAAIAAGLTTVDELDERYGLRLKSLSQDLAAIVNGQPDVIVQVEPGQFVLMDADDVVTKLKGMTPDQRAKYLAGLSPDDLRRVMQADPDTIGNLDGVPFPLRIDANEVNIRNALFDEKQKRQPDSGRIAQLESMLKPIDDPLKDPSGADDGKIERTFLAFKNNSNGHMIEVVGTIGPSTKNVATYVPGTGTNLNGSQTNHNAAWNLAEKSGAPVIVYMNGDLPQGMWPGLSDSDAFDTTPANQMAPGLVDFGHELDRTLAGIAPDAKTTFIGHSYGGPSSVLPNSWASTPIGSYMHHLLVLALSTTSRGRILIQMSSATRSPHPGT